jgi:hypothetical protein
VLHRYPGPGHIHAKLLATEQVALVGSHNYVQLGVNFGTAELAMLVRDADFAANITKAVVDQLKTE